MRNGWSHDFGCGLGAARNAGVLGVAIAGVRERIASKSILGDATAVLGVHVFPSPLTVEILFAFGV